MKLIDKDKVTAEIEERLHKYEQEYVELARYEIWGTAIKIRPKIEELKNLLSFISTLETKEVNEIIKTAEDHAYFAGCENTREKLIDKACEWLKKNRKNYSSNALGEEYLIDDFKKAMKGE